MVLVMLFFEVSGVMWWLLAIVTCTFDCEDCEGEDW
jgi:hypothetical protein